MKILTMTDDQNYSEAKMLMRKPASEVFEAMVDPAITQNFWFTKGSGRLDQNLAVTWEWEMYGVSASVEVLEIVKNSRIIFKWHSRTVEFIFDPIDADSVYVSVKEFGYTETGAALLAAIRDSTGGFTTVLDGMKAYLEHGIDLGLIADKFPKGK